MLSPQRLAIAIILFALCPALQVAWGQRARYPMPARDPRQIQLALKFSF
jgi:hypothetical protein